MHHQNAILYYLLKFKFANYRKIIPSWDLLKEYEEQQPVQEVNILFKKVVLQAILYDETYKKKYEANDQGIVESSTLFAKYL